MGYLNLCTLCLLSTVVITILLPSTEAGCQDLKQCCTGKNVNCRARGPRMNSPSSKVCFCDEYCLKLGDCCRDYQQACTAVDCVLGGWGPWSKCSKDCGWGKKERKRDVLQEPRHGGKQCDITSENGHCYGWQCKHPRHTPGRHELRETGKIIPAMYGSYRKSKLYNPYNDIRRNLFNHYSANQVIQRPPYCAKFEIRSMSHTCSGSYGSSWSKQLKPGTTVCIECQQFAMKKKLGVRCKGHGVYLQETRWSAFTVPGCHGKWVMREKHHECTCDASHDMSFILV